MEAWSLNRWTTREVLLLSFFKKQFVTVYLFFIGTKLLYNVVLVSAVQQSESAMCIHIFGVSLVAQMVKNLPAMEETQVQSLGREDSLEKGMASHSSILPWRSPWNSGGL